MHYADGSENGKRRPSAREHMQRSLNEFPGPIAVARTPPDGARQLCGGESENGRPYSIHVTYLAPSGQRLVVRTKAAPLPVDPENPPRTVTIDTLRNAFGIYGRRDAGSRQPPRGAGTDEIEAWKAQRLAEHLREQEEYESLPRIPVSVLIDAVPVPGFRIDYPDCSGVEFVWAGQTVQCVGEAAAIDALELRRAVPGEIL